MIFVHAYCILYITCYSLAVVDSHRVWPSEGCRVWHRDGSHAGQWGVMEGVQGSGCHEGVKYS